MSVVSALFGLLSYLYAAYVSTCLGCFLLNFKHLKGPLAEKLSWCFPYAIESPTNEPTAINITNLTFNLLDIALFACHHSLFARPFVKKILQLPKKYERSVYVLTSGFFLHNLLHFWNSHPIGGGIIFQFVGDLQSITSYFGVIFGIVINSASTFMIDHFELLGIRQSFEMKSNNSFVNSGFYGYIRHPIMAGFLLMLWLAPVISIDRLICNIALTVYIIIGIELEEKTLNQEVSGYKTYVKKVPHKVCPFY